MTVSIGQPVVIDYKDLISKLSTKQQQSSSSSSSSTTTSSKQNENNNLQQQQDHESLKQEIGMGFGNNPGCLGLIVIKNVPNLLPKRQKLLLLASKFANLPDEVKDKYVHLPSKYNFGWSHGKEFMNGKLDWAKGSFYNNPTVQTPSKGESDKSYFEKFPYLAYPNIWPTPELPELEDAFMDLGRLIHDVGSLVAKHCDEYIQTAFKGDLPPDFLSSSIEHSECHKARLLHYFPINNNSTTTTTTTPTTTTTSNDENPSEMAADSGDDSWCGLHIDSSMLTGLTSAMFVKESDPNNPIELSKQSQEMQTLLTKGSGGQGAGLYIRDREDHFVKVNIPEDCLAFQIGEAAQVASRGMLKATPHLVKACTGGGETQDIARNTFACFLQPNVDHMLTPELSYYQFTEQVMDRYYK